MLKVICSEFVLASLIRFLLASSTYRESIANRIEVSTFLNSWKRMTEGVVLYKRGINPYTGDIFHETPLALIVFDKLFTYAPNYIEILFIAADLVTSIVLYKTAKWFMKEMKENQELERKNYPPASAKLLLTEEDFEKAPIYVLSAYLFNPFIVLSCVGFTTTCFGNLLIAGMFYSMVRGKRISSCAFLALATLQSFYPIILIVPVSIYIARKSTNKFLSTIVTLCTFIFFCLVFLGLCFKIMGDWSFIYSLYYDILTVPDLHPNIGLFWYFFTEMFEHFRVLFVFSFQINATLLYLAPLTLRFHSNPMLLATSLIALITVFKSYPSLGDVGFYLSLLPMWKHLCSNMQQSFVIGCALVVTSVMGPTVWYLWIYLQSANANFYFGVTLAFATAQIFLITDLLFSYLKREFSLKTGLMDSDAFKHNIKLILE